MEASKLSSKGQITIPKEVRAAIGLKPGDLIGYEVQDAKVILRKIEPFDLAFHKALSETLEEWNSSEDDEAIRDL